MTNKNNESAAQSNTKFPAWDILPPFKFINPRVRAVEYKEEPKTKQDAQSIDPVRNPSTTSTIQMLTSDRASPSVRKDTEKCPACGASVQAEAEFCGDCGLRVAESTGTDKESSDDGASTIIKCPHCGEELELDESDEKVGEFSCPQCGKDFELLG